MGKLGKKARKFAKKNLQSVLKRKRKMKSMFKRKAAPSHRKGAVEDSGDEIAEQQERGGSEASRTDNAATNNFLDDLFTEADDSSLEDISDSDGYLSEDSECPYIEPENYTGDEDVNYGFEGENNNISAEVGTQKKILDSILEKDPQFSEFLATKRADLDASTTEDIYSDDEGDTDNSKEEESNEREQQTLTSCSIDVWCWMVLEEPNGPALSNLLNSFRTACYYGIDSDESPQRIPNKEAYSKILTFVLCEADDIFRKRLGISGSCSQERIVKLKNTSSWETVRPLLKSYLRSCLFLLNQVTDSQILVFVLTHLKASTVFFAAFPSLIRRLIKVSIHLWVTGEENLSLCSFVMLREIASKLSECLDKLLSETYRAFVAHCKFVQPKNLKHVEFLTDSVVELYSQDVQRSYQIVLLSLQHLSNALRRALKTKKKDELKKIYSWQYINCIDLWVKFIMCNIREYDLQPLSSFLIEVIIGVAHLFPGTRYLPLRFKCVNMLNKLSSASGTFIPIASLVFDCLEYKGSSSLETARGKSLNITSLLKVPKQSLKSQSFHEECVQSALELLLAHFSQWSHHISFPEVATIPMILLKRLHEKTMHESLRRSVKRLIDQVLQNIEFIQRKRDEVGFSPKDQSSVDSFVQLEKSGHNASFSQYYSSVLQKSQFFKS